MYNKHDIYYNLKCNMYVVRVLGYRHIIEKKMSIY